MSELTPAIVRGLWEHLSRELRSVVVSKPDAVEMRGVSTFLGAIGVVDAQQFLNSYATTLNHRIYVPFTVGVPEREWSLWAQLVTAAHEHQHVVQADEHGVALFALRYLSSRSGRALLEADAYRTQLELHFWRFGELPSLSGFAAHGLDGYALRPEDIAVAQRVLELSAQSIRRGAVITRAGRLAIDWLESHASGIRLRGPSA